MKRGLLVISLIFVAVIGLADVAFAATTGYTTHSVNLRAGPDRDYPLVGVIRNGSRVKIHGCVDRWDWCEVSLKGYRGWIAGDYLILRNNNRRVRIIDAGPVAAVPVISFNLNTYWDEHYRSKRFYRDRSRWEHHDHSRGSMPWHDRDYDDRGRGHGNDDRGRGHGRGHDDH